MTISKLDLKIMEDLDYICNCKRGIYEYIKDDKFHLYFDKDNFGCDGTIEITADLYFEDRKSELLPDYREYVGCENVVIKIDGKVKNLPASRVKLGKILASEL